MKYQYLNASIFILVLPLSYWLKVNIQSNGHTQFQLYLNSLSSMENIFLDYFD